MNQRKLPLFPLQIVLLPHSALPLHIFEERYKFLINECLEGGGEFGINLVRGETFAEIGCSASVRSVLRRYPDGRLDIVVEGRSRFRVNGLEEGDAPYLVAKVEFLPEDTEGVDTSLASETVGLYNRVVDMVFKGRVPALDRSEKEGGLSFVMAQKSGMDADQRQHLLELSSENKRLGVVKAHLAELLPKLVRIEEVERVVRSDGYL